MRAANPLEAAEPVADKRSYEPSMEEILASIRRIIADDQSLPGRPSASLASGDSHDAAQVELDVARYEEERAEAGLHNREPLHPPSSEPSREPADEQLRGQAREPIVEPRHEPAGGDPVPVRLRPAPTSYDQSDPVEWPQPSSYRAPPPEPLPPELGAFQPSHVLHEPGSTLRAPETPPAAPEPARPAEPSPSAAAQPDDVAEKPPIFSQETDAAVGAAFNMLAASRLASSSDEIMALAREMIRPLLRSWIDDNLPSMVERLVRAEIERVARGGR